MHLLGQAITQTSCLCSFWPPELAVSPHRCAPHSPAFLKCCSSGRCVDVGVLCQVGGQPLRNGTEEDLCLNAQQGDYAELVELGGVLLLWDPHPFGHSPLI